ncbi:2121_t:CDS:1, partial [Gigaspora rosea]
MFKSLYNHGLKEVKLILSVKDFAQISNGLAIWNDAKIQLCRWHMLRAIEQKLSSKYKKGTLQYNATHAHQQ